MRNLIPPEMKATRQTTVALNRRFGLLVGGALLVGAAHYYFRHQALQPLLLAAGSLLWVAAGLAPGWLTAPRIGWEAVGRALGRVNTYILLTLAYGLICIPLGWLLRRLGKDPLHQKWQPQATTYWQPKEAPSPLHFQF